MNMKKSFIVGLIASIIGLVLSDSTCPVFTCQNNLPTGKCSQRNSSDTGVISYLLQRCPENQDCKYNHDIPSSSCADKVVEVPKLYPGSACTNSTDCFSGSCTSGVCVGVKDGEACAAPTDCNFGKGCIPDTTKNGTAHCLDLIAENITGCTSDYDCQRKLGCNNGTCVQYFSLGDGTTLIANATQREGLPISLCKSGIELNGVCTSLKRVNQDCTTTGMCSYQRDGNATNFYNTTDFCECGNNNDGKSHCRIGSDEPVMITFINKTVEFLAHSSNCNTMERVGQCNDYKRYHADNMTYLAQNYTNSFYLAPEYHKYESSDDCAKFVTIPAYYEYLIPVESKKCPIYKCEQNSASKCGLSNFFTTEHRNHVQLDKGICKSTEFCSVGGNAWDIFADSETSVAGICKSITQHPPGKRYAGEPCDDTNTCLSGTCDSGYCSGKKSGDTCSLHEDCVVGYFCGNGTCTAQSGKNVACANSFECQNSLVCLDSKCQAGYYSKATGTALPIQTGFPMDYLCEFGTYDTTNKECSKKVLKNNTDSTGFAPCDYGSFCHYTFNDKSDAGTEECQCGYNTLGQGYCKPGHNNGKSK
jgi:hypothetical protein